MHKSPES
jgi:hypothetical protein